MKYQLKENEINHGMYLYRYNELCELANNAELEFWHLYVFAKELLLDKTLPQQEKERRLKDYESGRI